MLLAAMAWGSHPFPSRTRPLSPTARMVLLVYPVGEYVAASFIYRVPCFSGRGRVLLQRKPVSVNPRTGSLFFTPLLRKQGGRFFWAQLGRPSVGLRHRLNVAGVIGSAVAAGVLLTMFG